MKLLQKTTGLYLILSVVIFAISIPVFYTIVERLWMIDMDESLLFQKEKIILGIEKYDIKPQDIESFSIFLNHFDVGVEIQPSQETLCKGDFISTMQYYDEVRGHIEPFRILKTQIKINDHIYDLIISKDLVESEDLIMGIAAVQAILFFILLALIMMAITFYSKKVWRPFYSIIEQLKRIKINSVDDVIFYKTNVSEFRDLQISVDYLVRRNREIFNLQKEFTENASHEIQTPLSVIKNYTDILLSNPSITANELSCIEGINRNIRNVTNINKNLLLLSKIDNRQFENNDIVNLSQVLQNRCNLFEEEVNLMGKRFILTIEENVMITANVFLVNSLITNLIVNAIQHSKNEESISISLTNHLFVISNIATDNPLPVEKIFNRFYKHDTKSKGSGLGLAIVHKICKVLNYEIIYSFTVPNLHSFQLIFHK